ncbi:MULTISPECIES: OmpH family outer membrane protein [Croceibacter]|jgi:outer membrane protein|uniref:OmpH family outer membrane protein n=1 Tax=Croceibacter TaxID=216431 RepID=UPI000C37EFFF|nr:MULTISPECIES: OmpH family outer membrane protein [Croceibacter]MBG26377.1 outer membrane chaperone Skp [Croceibacter sp.]WSP33735.1 OmpH family outer membrane protein [Croceibacter atlanticus]|tara:strand:+ start:1479 stop:2015 length:537 start_codon:yes stop_codon:yes gene_type:complete
MMKNILLAAFFIVTTTVSMAQSKVGTVDVDFILTNMTDELKKVNDSLANYEASLSAQLQTKMTDYETKYKAFDAAQATMTDAMKQTKSQEIANVENDIMQFRKNGSQLLSLRRDQLLAPLYQRIGKALDAEAKAQNYSQVLNIGSGALGYADPKFDVTEAVMKRMGVTIKQQQPQGQN